MILKMNQLDNKCVLAIFVAAIGVPCAATCPENHFQVQESCCLNCRAGEYVALNCSDGPTGHIGGQCNECRRCEDIGEITVSFCTQFSDTQCAGKVHQITLYGCLSVIAAVIYLAVIVATCFLWRISKSGESDESSAGKPLHITV